MTQLEQIADALAAPFRRSRVTDIVAWAEEHMRLPGSARSERFRRDITPWILDPMRAAACGEHREVTFVKPIQCGGSTVGEVLLAYWILNETGPIHYNWEDDEKARERYNKRIEPILMATMGDAWPRNRDRHKAQRGLLLLPRGPVTTQGVFTESNLDSEAVRFVINEEVHNWEPGRLEMARGRTTAFWNAQILNISNASKKGDQLHQALEAGTHEEWRVRCPGCGEFHAMRTRWDDKRPDLGGLRYDADGARLGNGKYDYHKLAPTIRYQMPCGYSVRDTPSERRELSLSGRYSAGRNPGATNRSFILEAVAVDYIPWLLLIQEKHQALYARKHGDPELFRVYVTRRECGFYDPDDIPPLGRIVLSSKVKDVRGMEGRAFRFAMLDYQQGTMSAGELPHWWLVIQDFDADGNSLIAWEGKCLTDEEAAATIGRHEVNPWSVVADSGYDAPHVYAFCYKHGYNAIKGDSKEFFEHEDGKRCFSIERPLHGMIGQNPKFDYVYDRELKEHVADSREPLFWFYSKPGIRARLAWLRASKKFEIPLDVSDDFHSHMEAEEMRTRSHPRTGETIVEWVQLKTRNDLFVCCCYGAMLADMAGLIGGNDEDQKPDK